MAHRSPRKRAFLPESQLQICHFVVPKNSMSTRESCSLKHGCCTLLVPSYHHVLLEEYKDQFAFNVLTVIYSKKWQLTWIILVSQFFQILLYQKSDSFESFVPSIANQPLGRQCQLQATSIYKQNLQSCALCACTFPAIRTYFFIGGIIVKDSLKEPIPKP